MATRNLEHLLMLYEGAQTYHKRVMLLVRDQAFPCGSDLVLALFFWI